ncbi:MAG: hypothetical protein AAGK05_17580 [Pseudomonadota bacterium]
MRVTAEAIDFFRFRFRFRFRFHPFASQARTQEMLKGGAFF